MLIASYNTNRKSITLILNCYFRHNKPSFLSIIRGLWPPFNRFCHKAKEFNNYPLSIIHYPLKLPSAC